MRASISTPACVLGLDTPNGTFSSAGSVVDKVATGNVVSTIILILITLFLTYLFYKSNMTWSQFVSLYNVRRI